MKNSLFCVVVSVLGMVAASPEVLSQDILNYQIEKEFIYDNIEQPNQPRLDVAFLKVNIYSAPGGSLASASVTLPVGSTIASSVSINPNVNGDLIYQGFVSNPGLLDTDYANGTYGMNIVGGSGTYSANLYLTGGVYPSAVPTIANPAFDTAIYIDPSQDNTINWNAFTNFATGDFINLDFGSTLDYHLTTNATSQVIPAGSLAPDTTYLLSLDFGKVSDTDITDIPGVTGQAVYDYLDTVTLKTTPEPCSWVSLLFGVVALGWRRPRR